jgi:DNA-binding CsgD family transcriptional regulator
MAETYRLTPRETDILFRLAQGRSQPQIQKLLVLSSGTIKTHIAHIYEKMSVHSNQEILDLVFDESG